MGASTIAPLVETWVHLRREFSTLGGSFTFVKFPGHQGVLPMAGADAAAKACLRMPPTPVELIVHSSLVCLRAVPLNPAVLPEGQDAAGWRPYAGQPSPHAVNTRLMPFCRDRLQESGARRMVERSTIRQSSSECTPLK